MHVSLIIYIVITVALYNCSEVNSGHWSYSGVYGPANWSVLYPECGNSRQSPVDIVPANTVFDSKLDPIKLTFDEDSEKNNHIMNNGHTVNLEQSAPVIRLTGGNLGNTFRVAGVHFHWGKSSAYGSEHTVNGKHYPLEMHMVSYNEDRFDKLGSAIKASDGLAVIGLLFEESNEDNLLLDPIIEQLKEIKLPGIRVNLSHFDVTKFLPSDVKDYYRYMGSLTTPPCFESVTWTVLRQISDVSSSQLKAFRTLQVHAETHEESTVVPSDLYMDQNWRPTQPINNRVISRSFGGEKRPTIITKSEYEQPVNSQANKILLSPLTLIIFTCGYARIR